MVGSEAIMPVLHFCSVLDWPQATSYHVLVLHTTIRELSSTNLSIPIILCASQVLQHHRVCSMQIDNNTATTLTPAAEWIVLLFVWHVFRHILLCPSGTKCACQCIRTYLGNKEREVGLARVLLRSTTAV